jgi:hypothetical protein
MKRLLLICLLSISSVSVYAQQANTLDEFLNTDGLDGDGFGIKVYVIQRQTDGKILLGDIGDLANYNMVYIFYN